MDAKRIKQILDQKLDGDFQVLTVKDMEVYESMKSEWKCIKCTLINSGSDIACQACSGSRIQSITQFNNATLKKGEFWQCIICTLKNPYSVKHCMACQTKVDDLSCSKVKAKKFQKKFSSHQIKGKHTEIQSPSSTSLQHPLFENKQIMGLSDNANENHASHLLISNCKASVLETSHLASSTKHSNSSGFWSCKACTFDNTECAVSCKMCGTLPSSKDILCAQNTAANESSSDSSAQSMLMDVLREVEERESLEKWKTIVTFCKKTRYRFIDDSFPPAPKSLFCSASGSTDKTVCSWLRPEDIASYSDHRNLNWVVFRNPLPSDILQGVLGNCWLLSALAVLAEREDFLKKILLTKELCPQGVYLVRLCKAGRWVTVMVDDLLPCDKRRSLVYSQAKNRQLWVPLIEKAVAKMHGCYEALISGRAIEGLATLTGFPCESLPLQNSSSPHEDEVDSDLIWAQLLSSRSAGFLMGASCGGGNMKIVEEDFKSVGLRPRHAYSVLDVRDVEGLRFLRLRNPWGHFSWSGDWCDDSDLWTPELRDQLMPTGEGKRDPGVFWIAFEDVLRYFDCIDICKVHRNWCEVRIPGVLPPLADSSALTPSMITVFEPTELEFTLFQDGHRSSESSQRSMLDLCVVAFRSCGEGDSPSVGALMKHSKRQVRAFVGCQVMLEPGTYSILCLSFNHWGQGIDESENYPEFVLAIHSSKAVAVERVAAPSFLLADALIHLCLSKGQRHEGRQGMTVFYLTKGWAGLVVMVENRHPDKCIQTVCDCEESYNVVSTRGCLKTVDSIPPLHRQVIIVLTQLESSGGFSIAHRLTHRPSHSAGLQDWGPEGLNHHPRLESSVYGLHAPRPI